MRRPDTSRTRPRRRSLATAATLTRGRVLEEGQIGEVAAGVREALATGPTVDRHIEGNRQALIPYVALLAIFPLGSCSIVAISESG